MKPTLINIPEERQWLQPNTSVLFGNIFETKNIDFSLPGFLKLAPRTRYVGREDASTATFENLLSIVYMSPNDLSGTKLYYFLTNDKIFTCTTALGSFGALGVGSEPTLTINSDAIASGLYYIVSTDTEMSRFTTAWTNGIIATAGGAAMTSNVPHPLCYGFNTNIYVGNRNKVNQFTTNVSGLPSTYTADVVIVGLQYSIVWIRSFNSSIWIGTKNLLNGNAKVYQWDGSSTNFNYEYEVDCQWVYSGIDWQGNFFIFTNDGRLMSFNGAGFTEVARIPSYTNILTTNNYTFGNSFTLGSVFQRGMQVIDGLIHVNVNSEATNDDATVDGATTKLMSGIWVYDPNVGFYNKYTLSNSTSTTDTDFGQMALEDGAGAISAIFNDPTVSSPITSSVGGTLLYGAKLNSASATNYFTLGSVTTGENRGYFTTSRIESPEIQESWRYVWIKYEEMTNATDKIVLRYRTKEKEGIPFTTASTVTWTSSTTFTSTDTRFANVDAGDDVTVITGDGAGSIANITSITYSNPTYTVVVDEAITAVTNGDIGKVIVSNFHKIEQVISEATVDGINITSRYAKLSIPLEQSSTEQPAPSAWLELKVELRGENVRISEMNVLSETQTKTII